MKTLTQYDTIQATFQPRRTDDLRFGMNAFIGRTGTFTAIWIIEEGEYIGQWAMQAPEDWPCSWVPECDLVESVQEV